MTTSTEILPPNNELVLVTGASTGMGAATAQELARRGYHVVAGVRRESDADTIRTARIEPHILDITIQEHVDAIAARVAGDQRGRKLRAIINNAGIAINAPLEALPIEQWRRQFEVNLFGHIAVTQALLPALIDNSGRVVNISSVGGKVAMPTYGAYAGAKFAMEAVSDSLRREVAPFGVKVIIVEPGAVVTEIGKSGVATANRLAAEMNDEQHMRYDDLIGAIVAQAESFGKTGLPASAAAGIIANAIMAKNPRTRYAVGRDAAILTKVSRMVPDRLLDTILRRNLQPYYIGKQLVNSAAEEPARAGGHRLV